MDDLVRLGRRLAAARSKMSELLDECRDATIDAASRGVVETQIAKSLGVSRTSVRQWLGK